MTIEQQTSASASFVASAPVSIDIAALNVDIGSSGSCRSDIDDPVRRTVNRGVSWQRTTGGREALFDSGLLSDADRSAHRLFGVSVENDTALSASNSASGVGVKLTYGNNPACPTAPALRSMRPATCRS